MPILFGLNVFNEIQFIETCLREIYPFARRIVVVDGAYVYALPPDGNPASTDGTLEAVHDFPDPERKIVLVRAERPWESQIPKLNAYLSHGMEGDWAFRVDPDERIVGDMNAVIRQLSEAPPEVTGFSVPFAESNGNRYKWFRIVRWRPELRYALNHWRMFYGDEELDNHDTHWKTRPKNDGRHKFGVLDGIFLRHQEHSPERERLKRTWYASRSHV